MKCVNATACARLTRACVVRRGSGGCRLGTTKWQCLYQQLVVCLARVTRGRVERFSGRPGMPSLTAKIESAFDDAVKDAQR